MIEPLAGKQRDLVTLGTRRFNIAEGAVRSGKTVGTLIGFLIDVYRNPGPRIIVGRTQQTIERNVVYPLQQMVGMRRAKYRRGEELTLFGSPCYIIGGNNEQSFTRLSGITAQGAYADEISLLPKSFFQMLTTRMSLPGAKLFGTTNPAGPGHWFLTDWLAHAALWIDMQGDRHDLGGKLDLVRFTFGLHDNPHLPPEYVEALDSEHTGMWRQRYVQGLWVAAVGSIWPAFLEQTWDKPLPEILSYYIVGLDHGTTNPFAGILVAEDVDRRAFAIDEFYHDSRVAGTMTDAEYVQAIRAWLGQAGTRHPGASSPTRLLIDPAANHMYQALRRAGMSAYGADNDVLSGIRLISSMLTARRLWIVPGRCPNLMREGSGYAWDPAAQEKGEDKPIKQNDHTCDGLRYVANDRARSWNRWLAVPV